MRPSFVFASDLHGDTERMRDLVKKAIELGCPHIILGGDLFRAGGGNSIEGQRRFLVEDVQPAFEVFDGDVHTIFGNNDWGIVSRDFGRLCPKLEVFEGGSFRLDEGIEVVGCSHVPVTPFPIKDWDRIEATSPVSPMSRIDGYCSWEGELNECVVRDDRTLMDELTRSGSLAGKVLVSHGPPYGTSLDLGWGGEHLGSTDLRELILSDSPQAVLSGHIHESPEMSGAWKDKIGKTICVNPGPKRIVSFTTDLKELKLLK